MATGRLARRMDFDFGWLLLGLPLAFVAGWVASRFDLRQLRMENRLAPKAYFRGLNFLLNEQQDQAIDAFIEAVQNDPDTSELHFALGNLFRRRGDYERAVRVHEHLLSRGDLSQQERERAQHDLALDYLKAGLIDRAEVALRKLEGTPYEEEAWRALLGIHERSRDWTHAGEIARRLETLGQGGFGARQAHYLCERAQEPGADVRALLLQAMALAPAAARPRIDFATLQQREGAAADSLETLLELSRTAPASLPLVAARIASRAIELGAQDRAREVLRQAYEAAPSLDVLEALVALDPDPALGRALYVQHIEREPSLVATTRWLSSERLEHEAFHPQVQRALEQAARPLLRYRCAACGFEARQHFWQCPGCQAWDSFPARRVEEL